MPISRFLALAAAAAAAVAATAGGAPAATQHLDPAPSGAAARAVRLVASASVRVREASPDRMRSVAREQWQGGPTVTDTGEVVDLFVSDNFAEATDPAARTAWASFFTWLYHGSELSQLAIYEAPTWEVEQLCGGPNILGCYGDIAGQSTLVFPGDLGTGADMEVATHEYGHHIASHRLNDPWSAIDWGPKHWATYAGVCSRTAAQTAFPGDEGAHYALNPGEAFAESYRELNIQRGEKPWVNLPWNVDPSFMPDAGALAAVLADVQSPWTGPTAATWSGRFASLKPPAVVRPKAKPKATLKPPPKKQAARHLWSVKRTTRPAAPPQTRTIGTPVDGLFTGTVSGTANASLELLDPTTGQVLVPPTPGTLSFTVCGQRSLKLEVVPATDGTFAVTTSTP